MARLYPQWSAQSAPAVGGLGGLHERIAQFAQFGCPGTFVKGRRDVFGRAPHLVDAVGQVSGLVSGQHDRVGRQRRTFGAVDRGALLVSALPTRPPAVLTAPTQTAIRDIASTPAARLRADATAHGADFSPGSPGIPVSWIVESLPAISLCAETNGNSGDRLIVVRALAAEKRLRGVGTNG
jgi:hypothetical protein